MSEYNSFVAKETNPLKDVPCPPSVHACRVQATIRNGRVLVRISSRSYEVHAYYGGVEKRIVGRKNAEAFLAANPDVAAWILPRADVNASVWSPPPSIWDYP